MTANKTRKKILIIGITLAVAAVITAVVILLVKRQQDKHSVEVIPVSYIASQNWNDEIYSSGQASSDFTQELYPDSQKVIEEIFVTEGQSVKIGDPLLQYDKTLLELDLEKKQLELQSKDEEIRLAQKELEKLWATTPVIPSTPEPIPEPEPEPVPTPEPTPTPIPPASVTVYSEIQADSVPYAGSGTSEDPFVYLCTPDCVLDKDFLLKLFGLTTPTPSPAPTEPPASEPSSEDPSSENSNSEPEEPSSQDPNSEPEPSSQEPPVSETPSPTPSPESTAFAAVFEIREENSNFGKLLHSFTIDGTAFTSSFSLSELTESEPETDSPGETDFPETPLPITDLLPDISEGGGDFEITYTPDELKQATAAKESEIKSLQLARKQLVLDSDKAQLLVDNSTVHASIDGVVRSLISIDEANETAKPFLVVSGENTFYLHGTINESLLGSIKVGDTVDVNSWEAGRYSAQIVSIGSYPMQENAYYGGSTNPNSSTYEFTAVFLDTDGIYNGMYFDITIQASSLDTDSENGSFYIDKMYVREDDAGSYVMKKGPNGRLLKQPVETGKMMGGGYAVEIKSGLTQEDSVAFPYGKDLREGMRTRPKGSDEDYQEEPGTDTGGEIPPEEIPMEDGMIGGDEIPADDGAQLFAESQSNGDSDTAAEESVADEPAPDKPDSDGNTQEDLLRAKGLAVLPSYFTAKEALA